MIGVGTKKAALHLADDQFVDLLGEIFMLLFFMFFFYFFFNELVFGFVVIKVMFDYSNYEFNQTLLI